MKTRTEPVVLSWREMLRQVVTDNPEIDIVIVHHADGSNDFFSSKPEVERCERWRVIEVCRGIIRVLEAVPRRSRSCSERKPGPACPSED